MFIVNDYFTINGECVISIHWPPCIRTPDSMPYMVGDRDVFDIDDEILILEVIGIERSMKLFGHIRGDNVLIKVRCVNGD